jgi:hypothetical protein
VRADCAARAAFEHNVESSSGVAALPNSLRHL